MKMLIGKNNREAAILYKQALENRKHNVTITLNGFDCLREYHNMFHEMAFGKYHVNYRCELSSSSPLPLC
jgi:hypothetical protein